MGCGESEPSAEDIRRDAVRVCEEEFIPPRLKAPATAEYDLTASGGPVTYTVSGTVDSENSFGAKIRSTWTCTVGSDGSASVTVQ